jgi:hypothetical protein
MRQNRYRKVPLIPPEVERKLETTSVLKIPGEPPLRRGYGLTGRNALGLR